jgi:hypothetical protein
MSVSSRSRVKSIGLVNNPLAPLSIALRLADWVRFQQRKEIAGATEQWARYAGNPLLKSFIAKAWTKEPERFKLNPINQMPGLNSY